MQEHSVPSLRLLYKSKGISKEKENASQGPIPHPHHTSELIVNGQVSRCLLDLHTMASLWSTGKTS